MTSHDFMQQIVLYYGEFKNKHVEKYVRKFIKNFDDEYLTSLFENLLLKLSSSMVPDIAAMVRHKPERVDYYKPIAVPKVSIKDIEACANIDLVGMFDEKLKKQREETEC